MENCGATNPSMGAISLTSMPTIPGPLASAVMRLRVSYHPSPPGSGVPKAGTIDASSPSQSNVRYTGVLQAATTSGIQFDALPSYGPDGSRMVAAKNVVMRAVTSIRATSSWLIDRIPTWTKGKPSSTTRAMTQAWLNGLP